MSKIKESIKLKTVHILWFVDDEDGFGVEVSNNDTELEYIPLGHFVNNTNVYEESYNLYLQKVEEYKVLEFEETKKLFKKHNIKFDKKKYKNNTLHENLEIKHFKGIDEAKDFFNNELIVNNPSYINRYLYWLYLDRESIQANSEFGETIDFGNWFSNSDTKNWDGYDWQYPSIYQDLEEQVLPNYNYDINVMKTVLYTGGNAFEMANDDLKHNTEFVYECIVYASTNEERQDIINLLDDNIKNVILSKINQVSKEF